MAHLKMIGRKQHSTFRNIVIVLCILRMRLATATRRLGVANYFVNIALKKPSLGAEN